MTNTKEKRLWVNISLIVMLVLLMFSNIFSYSLEIFLHIRPNITKSFETQVHFVDVGQGDAIAIKFSNGKTMLVDSGTKEYCHKLKYYLDNVVLQNSKTIDYVVLTHPDVDHSGNMNYILENYKVGTFYRPAVFEIYENREPSCENYTYRQLLKTLVSKDICVKFNTSEYITDGDVTIRMLTTLDTANIGELSSTNDYSPTIIIEDNDVRVLLAGDISEDIERELILKYSEVLDVDILKLSHHGSKYSNTTEFLSITSPKIAVASCGVNTYGHPANETIKRILDYDKANNTDLFDNYYSTLESGNVVCTLKKDIQVDCVKNIDNYNFVDYWIYTLIFSVFIIWIIISPYIKVWKKNYRFKVQNKQFEKYLASENQNRSAKS